MEEFVAGAVGGASGLLVGHPLEVVKVQMQLAASGSCGTPGIRAAAAAVIARGITKGLYRGLAFPLVSFTATNAVFFGCYSKCLQSLLNCSEPGEVSEYASIYLAGMAGGVAQMPLLNPVELVKTAMQAQISSNGEARFYKGPIDCAKTILRNDGFLGFTRGLSVTCARDVPSYGLYMVAYEWLYRRLTGSTPDSLAQLLAGGVAGSLCWLSVLPIDVIKSNIQAEAATTSSSSSRGRWLRVIRSVYSEAGLRGFFTGGSIILMRAFPVNAVTFFAWARTQELLRG